MTYDKMSLLHLPVEMYRMLRLSQMSWRLSGIEPLPNCTTSNCFCPAIIIFTDDEVLKWLRHRDVVTHSSVQLLLRSCVLFDTSLKLYSNRIRISSIKILVFKKLVLSPDEFLARNSYRDQYEKQETRFFLICITYKVNTTRVFGNEKPKTRILPYL